MFSKLITLMFLPYLITAIAIPPPANPAYNNPLLPRAKGDTAAVQLLSIAPNSGSCAGADFPSECATNVQAAPYLIAAMIKYQISSPAEMAALLALIAFETADFKYNVNVRSLFLTRLSKGFRILQLISLCS